MTNAIKLDTQAIHIMLARITEAAEVLEECINDDGDDPLAFIANEVEAIQQMIGYLPKDPEMTNAIKKVPTHIDGPSTIEFIEPKTCIKCQGPETSCKGDNYDGLNADGVCEVCECTTRGRALSIKRESTTTGDLVTAKIEIGTRSDGRYLLARVEIWGDAEDGYTLMFEDFGSDGTCGTSNGPLTVCNHDSTGPYFVLASLPEAMAELERRASGFVKFYTIADD